jgi:hypothetical protein
LRNLIFFVFLFVDAISFAWGGNCLVQGEKKVGNCDNVHVNESQRLDVKRDGFYSGNFSSVRVRRGVSANISGNADVVTVDEGAHLILSGNTGSVSVRGQVEIDGNCGWITAKRGSQVTIRGIVEGVSGEGRVVKEKGSIVGGVYIK